MIDGWLAADAAAAGDAHPPGPGARLRLHRRLPDGAPLRRACPPETPQRARGALRDRARHQAQVDWSHEEPIRTSAGMELPLYGFHMVLGHSRDAFVRFCGSQDLVTFWACHRAAFAHFGGVPHGDPLRPHQDRRALPRRRRRRGLDRSSITPRRWPQRHHYGFALAPLPARLTPRPRARSRPTCAGRTRAALREPRLERLRAGQPRLGEPGTRRSPGRASTARTARSSPQRGAARPRRAA